MNKVVLITGGGRGIGAKTALKFAEHGYFVAINYLRDHQAAAELKSTIKKAGGQCECLQADVSDEAQVAELFASIDKLGTLTVLVNNAGVLERQASLQDISVERLHRVFNSNFVSCFLCTKAAIERMSTQRGGAGGAIVNVSSGAAKTGSPNEYVDYAASKGAMDTFTRGIAMEVAEQGIRVNSVRPGLIYTQMHELGGEPGRVDRLQSKIPLQRGGQPQEVASAIYWLASDEASFVTGSFIDTTGGL